MTIILDTQIDPKHRKTIGLQHIHALMFTFAVRSKSINKRFRERKKERKKKSTSNNMIITQFPSSKNRNKSTPMIMTLA